MKEERMKVLEMLQDGKITAEDAMKLLDALGDTAEEPQTRQRRRNGSRQRQRRRRRTGGADIQVEVQERIREAQDTLREAMPKARRAVREATRSIPMWAKSFRRRCKRHLKPFHNGRKMAIDGTLKKRCDNLLKQRRSRYLIVYP